MNVVRKDECCVSPVAPLLVALPPAKDQQPKMPFAPLTVYAMLAFCLLSWASSYTAIKVAVVHFEPHHVASLRFAVASLVLAPFLAFAKPTMPSRGDLGRLLLYGASGIAVYNVLLCTAERGVNAGTASFIVGIAPIFAAVLAAVCLKEKLSAGGWIALAVAFVGAAMMSAGKTGGLCLSMEVLALLAAAVLSGISLTVQKSLLNRITPLACTIYTVWAGTLLLLPFLPGALCAASKAPTHAVLSVVYLGAVPVAIGYVFWSFVMKHTNVGRAAAFLYFVPALAALQACVFLREVPSCWEVAGGAVIMLAVLGSSPASAGKLGAIRAAFRESMRTKPMPPREPWD